MRRFLFCERLSLWLGKGEMRAGEPFFFFLRRTAFFPLGKREIIGEGRLSDAFVCDDFCSCLR